jgi:hypothetical protein
MVRSLIAPYRSRKLSAKRFIQPIQESFFLWFDGLTSPTSNNALFQSYATLTITSCAASIAAQENTRREIFRVARFTIAIVGTAPLRHVDIKIKISFADRCNHIQTGIDSRSSGSP